MRETEDAGAGVLLEGLERFVNFVSDRDSEWGPLLFLRPERDERMTSARVALLSILYGVVAGVAVNAVVRLTGERAESLHPLFFPASVTLAFFVVYRFTFAFGWNRRAERLLRGERE
jgi:hypothetical protein